MQPELSREVRAEKLERLREVGPELLLTSNPGCEFFLESGLAGQPDALPVQHLAVYLAQRLESVYGGDGPPHVV